MSEESETDYDNLAISYGKTKKKKKRADQATQPNRHQLINLQFLDMWFQTTCR
eukprot:JP436898.1.p3 GENE.JP436898.1~~JP436898.1.p3  ORF type:complete len:53 (-),score=4.30 JP436898.1:197-355(-)